MRQHRHITIVVVFMEHDDNDDMMVVNMAVNKT